MNNATYNDHVAELSLAGGVLRAILRLKRNPFRLVSAELQSRFAPRFA